MMSDTEGWAGNPPLGIKTIGYTYSDAKSLTESIRFCGAGKTTLSVPLVTTNGKKTEYTYDVWVIRSWLQTRWQIPSAYCFRRGE